MTVRGATRSKPRPTVLRGTCLVHGRHPAGSREAAECPLLSGRITPEENARRIGHRVTENPGGPMGVQAPGFSPPLPRAISGASDTRKRDGATVEAPPLADARLRLWNTRGRGGRSRTSLTEKLRKARERARRYRARKAPA